MESPITYCEELLSGKSLPEMERKISGLHKAMARLKTQVELPEFADDIRPSKRTQIGWYRECLLYARALYEQAGGVYKPSKAERDDYEFNARVDEIESISFTRSVCFRGSESWIVRFTEENAGIVYLPGFAEPSEPKYFSRNKQEWLEKFKNIHIGEWHKSYLCLYILDGEQWSLEIGYRDGKLKTYEGSNIYPFSYGDLLNLLEITPLR